MLQRAFTNILTDDVAGTARFYEQLLGLERRGEFGWFCLLGHAGFELGVLDRHHPSVPQVGADAGVILTFVVDDLAHAYETAQAIEADILEPPTPQDYGQTRLLLRDPAGTIVDVSAPTA